MKEQVDRHEKEINDLKSDFKVFKTRVEQKLEDILDKIKPQFTTPQILTFLIALITWGASILIYVTDSRGAVEIQKTRLDYIEKLQSTQSNKLQDIYNILSSEEYERRYEHTH